jgi:histone H3/H4
VSGVTESSAWKRCSVCKNPIAFDTRYYLCSVSTCNKKRMTLVFCSVSCWDAHQADARHRDAGAEEARSPSQATWTREVAEEKKRNVASAASNAPVTMKKVVGAASLDILIVGSRFKEYIAERAGMSTSERVLGFLSDHLRELCDQAIGAASKDGRRTVMDRDLVPLTTKGAASFATGTSDADDRPDEVIVVVSKVKDYIKARAGMNTSDNVAGVLSAHLRRLARAAIRRAGTDDRKTVLDRDFATLAKPAP